MRVHFHQPQNTMRKLSTTGRLSTDFVTATPQDGSNRVLAKPNFLD